MCLSGLHILKKELLDINTRTRHLSFSRHEEHVERVNTFLGIYLFQVMRIMSGAFFRFFPILMYHMFTDF